MGLLKEVQSDYFGKGKLSTEEYTSSIEQYEERLGKLVQRRVELENEKKNFLRFQGKSAKFRQEKASLEKLVVDLQRSYLSLGKFETRTYENQMRSYTRRLSEVEEAIAVSEAEENMRADRSLANRLFKKKAPAEQEGGPSGKPQAPSLKKEESGKETKLSPKKSEKGKPKP